MLQWWMVSSDVIEDSGRMSGVEHTPSSPQEYPVVAWCLWVRRLHEEESERLCRRRGLRWVEALSEAVRLLQSGTEVSY
jgi:hypothetical protein